MRKPMLASRRRLGLEGSDVGSSGLGPHGGGDPHLARIDAQSSGDSSGVPVSALASRRASFGGVLGSGFALLCCAGAVPVLGLLSAIGLGFLINDAVLVPLLLLSLGLTGWGLLQGRRCHGRHSALPLGLGGAALTVGGLYLWLPLAFVGFGAVMLASVWNLRLLRTCTISSSTSA